LNLAEIIEKSELKEIDNYAFDQQSYLSKKSAEDKNHLNSRKDSELAISLNIPQTPPKSQTPSKFCKSFKK
jgi:hypothetical protein